MRTRKDVDDLMANWTDDPCWDLEDTEGFEEYRDELLAYSQKMQDVWESEHLGKLRKKAQDLGTPKNLALASYVIKLEQQIIKFEEQMMRLEEQISNLKSKARIS